jgi:integrase
VVKSFAESLATAKLGPKTIREVVAVVKMILESHVNADGEPLLTLSWNHDFVFQDIPNVGKQHQPAATKNQINAVLKNKQVKARDKVLITLAASTGLRVGEILALRVGGSWKNDGVIRVTQSIWKGKTQLPKTASSLREINLAPSTNAMLAEFTADMPQGAFIFATRTGKPLDAAHIRKYILKPTGIPGMHSLRRYRATFLREKNVPYELIQAWLGHARGQDVTERYSKLDEDQELRTAWAERVGTGLDLSLATKSQMGKVGHPARQSQNNH